MRNNIRILITGAGHPIALGTLRSLRGIEDREFYIVGVDVKERGRGFDWVDSHYTVPPAKSDEYVPSVMDICQREMIDVVIPWSDDEIEAMSAEARSFEHLGIALLCSTPDSVKRTLDKGTMLEEMGKTGVPIPRYEILSSPEDVGHAVHRLGYPETPVIIKPRRASCSQGLWIIDPDIDLMHCPGQRLPLPAFLSLVNENQALGRDFPRYVAMQYLEGEDFSVDVLADSGTPLFIIPRKRIRTVEGVCQICEIVPESRIKSVVTDIIREFGFHLNVNVQLKYTEKSGGTPLVYEINPRISGSIVTNHFAGVNLLYYGILMAMGMSIPSPESFRIRQTRITRYWTERSIHGNEWFLP